MDSIHKPVVYARWDLFRELETNYDMSDADADFLTRKIDALICARLQEEHDLKFLGPKNKTSFFDPLNPVERPVKR